MEGKRVSWVELYLDLVFVLAIGQIAHLIVAEPEMHSVWVALGLFFVLWWTWVGFAVLYNRQREDAPLQRLLFLAGSVPAGVAAVAIEPASEGDVTVFAISLAVTRLVLAVANGEAGHGTQLLQLRIARAADLGRAVPRLRVGARTVPLRVVGDRHRRRVGRDAGRGSRRHATRARAARLEPAHALRSGRGARRVPLRRALRAVPDHPARRGLRRGGPVLGGAARRHHRRLDRARRGDGAGGRTLVAVLRLGRGREPARARAVGRLADDGACRD